MQRLRDRADECIRLFAENQRQAEHITALEAELADASQPTSRCDRCGGDLACPKCYRAETWD